MAPPQPPDGLPPVLSTEEVAELLRLNPKTVLAMARDGRLPGHRLPGCRKVQYLTSEILATVAEAPAIEETSAPGPTCPRSGGGAPAEVDPCDIWGPAPGWDRGEDWRERCCSHWVALAHQAGLPATAVGVGVGTHAKGVNGDKRSAGRVDVEGLSYEVLVGPRQRTRYIDDEGETCWGLIDAVWAEPIE